MAKPLKTILGDKRLEGVKGSTTVPGSTGTDPGVDYDPKAPAEQDFVAKHKTEKFDDRVGNKDVPYSAPKIKQALLKPEEKRHGHTQPAAVAAYKAANEEVEQIDEIGDTPAGRNVLKSYIKKAGGGTTNSAVAHQSMASDSAPGGQLNKTSVRKTINRVKGVERAADRLEAVECNHSGKGTSCAMHGEDACPGVEPKDTPTGTKKVLLDKKSVAEGRIEDDAQRRAAKELSAIASKSNAPVTKLKPSKKSYNQIKSTGGMFGGARQFAAGLAKRNIEADSHHGSTTKAKVGGKLREDAEQIDEVTKIVSGVKGSEKKNRYVMHTYAPGEHHEWSSIVKTHQDGQHIQNEYGGYPSMRTGKTAYVKRHFDKITEDTQLDEVITKKTPVSKVISDFVHSDDPRFAGKSKRERQRMALGAYYGKHPEKSRNEDVSEDLAMPMLEGGKKKKKVEKESGPADTPIKFPSGNVGDTGRV